MNEEFISDPTQILQLAFDQHGSRLIQNILESDNEEKKTFVFKILLPKSNFLMKDKFGNYVFQKMFEKSLP